MKTITTYRPAGLLVLVTAVLVGLLSAINIQGQEFRTTPEVRSTLERLETNSDRFSKSIDSALDQSRFNNTDLEDQANALVDEFEYATDRLKDRAKDNIVNGLDINEVLRRGMYLDMFMQRHTFARVAERDWIMVRSDLDKLARFYGVKWTWVPQTMQDPTLNKAWTKQVVQRLEETTDQFRNSFDEGLDRSRIDGSSYEDFMNNIVKQFERSVDRLEEDAKDSKALNATDLKMALNNAAAIDEFLKRFTLPLRTRRDWARVKVNLDDLAFLNHVAWDWTMRAGTSPVATSAPVTRNIPDARGQRVGLLNAPATTRPLDAVAREVRHELLSDLPYYTVFDWIEFEVSPDNTVTLRGQVTTPPDTKARAEDVVRDVPGVSRVVNEIRVLPVSPNDTRLRRELYNALYGFNSPLFRYGVGSRQAIHIIVDGGRATLKGIVDTQSDRQQAYQRARGVPGLFAVNNELIVKGESIVR